MTVLMATWVLGLLSTGSIVLQAGDRLVLVGDALIERAPENGYLETALQSRFAEVPISVRNLGWSGDTVRGLSRAYFDPPAAGWDRLLEQIANAEPSVLIIGYGMSDSFAGPAGLETFRTGLAELIERVRGSSRIVVLLSPLHHEALPAPLPDPAGHNAALARYTEIVRATADGQDAQFVDLWTRFGPERFAEARPITTNGIHLTDRGYWLLALELEEALGLPAQSVHIALDATGELLDSKNALVTMVNASDGTLEFNVRPDRLPTPVCPEGALDHPGRTTVVLSISGLEPGNYVLKLDGAVIAHGLSADWSSGIELASTPWHAQAERLRSAIVDKNRLHFHRYRPQNMTYLLGFRRHEQGQNAKEIDELDARIDRADATIAKMKRPVQYGFVLVKEAP